MAELETDPNAHNRVAPEDRGPGMDEPVHYTYARPEDKPPERDVRLVDAVKASDHEAARALLTSGVNVHQRAEQDWTPLCFAAGRGDLAMVKLLVEHGADVTVTGRDRRRPRAIARAAGKDEVAQFLEEREKAAGAWQDPAASTRYCKAYYLRQLRAFPGWREGKKNWNIGAYWSDDIKATFQKDLTDEDTVFIHQDLTVTRSMWHGEHVIFDERSPEWEKFVRTTLGFSVSSP